MKNSERFAEQQLEATLLELQAVREAFRSLSQRLSHAEEHLRFYANPKNYLSFRDPILTTVFQDRVVGDHEEAANGANTKVAGARARRYFKNNEDLPNSRL